MSVSDVKIEICKTIILLVVLYRCEAWPLTLREEHKLNDVEGAEEKICTQAG
jgi:hypothetical protein